MNAGPLQNQRCLCHPQPQGSRGQLRMHWEGRMLFLSVAQHPKRRRGEGGKGTPKQQHCTDPTLLPAAPPQLALSRFLSLSPMSQDLPQEGTQHCYLHLHSFIPRGKEKEGTVSVGQKGLLRAWASITLQHGALLGHARKAWGLHGVTVPPFQPPHLGTAQGLLQPTEFCCPQATLLQRHTAPLAPPQFH